MGSRCAVCGLDASSSRADLWLPGRLAQGSAWLRQGPGSAAARAQLGLECYTYSMKTVYAQVSTFAMSIAVSTPACWLGAGSSRARPWQAGISQEAVPVSQGSRSAAACSQLEPGRYTVCTAPVSIMTSRTQLKPVGTVHSVHQRAHWRAHWMQAAAGLVPIGSKACNRPSLMVTGTWSCLLHVPSWDLGAAQCV
jgi:hypothetical protein